MWFKTRTISHQIFLSIITLISCALGIIAYINIQQVKKDTTNYNLERLSRKDRSVAKSFEAMVDYSQPLDSSLHTVLNQIRHIHKINVNIYDLQGNFIAGSDSVFSKPPHSYLAISLSQIETCLASLEKKIEYEKNGYYGTYRILYKPTTNYLDSDQPIITEIPFCILDVIYDKSTKNDISIKTTKQVSRLIRIYILLLILAVFFSYLLLKQITSPLTIISKQISNTDIYGTPKPLSWPVEDEIGRLIDSYNNLIQELETRTQQLIKSEKEGAWKKMAKQIAHEIKNPLTPMRLSIQYLQKSYLDGKGRGLYSDSWEEKLMSFSKTMIQQVDTLNRIANAFSDFASLSNQNLERLSMSKEVERVVNLFKNNNVKFKSSLEDVGLLDFVIDKSHLTRILNNLIKNSLQSERPNAPIEVLVELKKDSRHYILLISDNGTGISQSIQDKIYEPNFTTKNSGMGLGLAMVKNIIDGLNGGISYETSSIGTIFKIQFPIIHLKNKNS